MNRRDVIWLLVGILICFFIGWVLPFQGLSRQGQLAIALLFLCVTYFIFEPIPLVATAFIIGIFQVVTGIKSHHEVPKTYMHDAIFFIMGALMVARVLIKYGYHEKLAVFVLKIAGHHINRIVFTLVAISAIFSSFISEHAVASIMLPVGIGFVSLSGGNKRNPNLAKLLMFAIGVGCMIGAIATPSGGMRNVLMINYFQQFQGIDISYGRWMIYVYPCTCLLIFVVSWLLPRIFKPEIVDLSQAAEQLKSQLEKKGEMTRKEKCAGLLFVALILFWILGSQKFGLGTVALIGATFFMMTGFMKWGDYEKGIHWNVVFTYAGIVSLGSLLETTGAAIWLAERILALFSAFGIHSGIALTAASSIATMLIANMMGAGPAIAVMGPIVLTMAKQSGDSIIPIGLATAIASSFSFFLVVGSPVNIIIYGSGFLKPSDFPKMGALMAVACMVIVIGFMVGLYWPLIGL